MRWIILSILLVGMAALMMGFVRPRRRVPIAKGRSTTAQQRIHPAHYIESADDRRVAARILPWGPRDYFQAIVNPVYVPVEVADHWMSDDEVVLGLSLAGAARAYPIHYLNDHEMVSEELAGIPILVTW